MRVAFKLLCDEYGRVFGIEAGDDHVDPAFKAGDFIGNVETVKLGARDAASTDQVGALNVSEVVVTNSAMAAARCCWKFILNRWVCIPC